MKVYEFIDTYLSGTVSMRMLTRTIGRFGIIGLINIGLNWVYMYGRNETWTPKTRTIRNEYVKNVHCNPLIFQTLRPIAKVIGFYLGQGVDIKVMSSMYGCICNDCNECGNEPCDCTCECFRPCNNLIKLDKVTKVAPGTILQDNQYKISGGQGGGGSFGNRIELKLCKQDYDMCACDNQKIANKGVYVQYFSWFNPITCLTDTLPVPPSYLSPLSLYIASLAISRLQNMRVGDDQYYLILANQQMNMLMNTETNVGSALTVKC